MISCSDIHRGRRGSSTRLAVAALVVSIGVVGPASVASAGHPPTIFQGDPTQGLIVAGSKFSTYLQVAGNNGTVTYTESAGAPNLTVSGAGQVVAAAGLEAGTYQASGSDRDASGGVGSWTFQLSVVAPAPGTFTATAVKVYQSEYDYNAQHGQGSALESVSQYQQDVSTLSPVGRALFYRSVQRAPVWLQIPSILQSVAGAEASSKAATARHATSNDAGAGTPPQPFQPGGSASDSACDGGPSDEVVFDLQIVVDAASTVYNEATAAQILTDSLGPGVSELAGPYIFGVTTVANVVLGAAQIAEDTLSFQQLPGSECQQNDLYGYSANIDNTTVQSYNLLTAAATALGQIQTTASTTDHDVLNLQSQVTALQTTLSASLAQDTKTLQSAIGSDTQGIVTQLQTDNGAIQQKESQNGADQWTIEIENALTASGAVAPVPLEVQGANGGLLTLPNAAGVSVQSVVLADMQALQSSGDTIPSSATDACNNAADDLTSGLWQAAYEDFRTCYHDFATLP